MADYPSRADLELLEAARQAREAAYAPYSKFKVGAAVRTRSDNVYSGCNVENASFGLSICAERVAIFNAVAAGDADIVDLAVFTDAEEPSPPCGACRQVLFEFGRSARVIRGNAKGSVLITNLCALFPQPFELHS
jgi:cytidine deaminase